MTSNLPYRPPPRVKVTKGIIHGKIFYELDAAPWFWIDICNGGYLTLILLFNLCREMSRFN
jgi:hypothetical protein